VWTRRRRHHTGVKTSGRLRYGNITVNGTVITYRPRAAAISTTAEVKDVFTYSIADDKGGRGELAVQLHSHRAWLVKEGWCLQAVCEMAFEGHLFADLLDHWCVQEHICCCLMPHKTDVGKAAC